MSFSVRGAARYHRRRWGRRRGAGAASEPHGFVLEIWRAACLASFLFLLLGFRPTSASAEITIEARIGFHGVFQLGRPFPLEIELGNSGRPAEGFLQVEVWKGGATKGGTPYPLSYTREIFLPPQSRRTVQFTVDPDFISRPLSISFSSPAGNASRELDLRRYFSPVPVILLVNEAGSVGLSLGSLSQNRLVTLSLSELPSDPRALLGVSHLVLYDPSLRELSRDQLAALEIWLTAGGRMIILGSLNYALYQEPAISRFLPVRVNGSRRITFKPPPVQGSKNSVIDGVWAQSSTLVSGEILLESAGMPLLVESSRGKGRITYLSLDVGRAPLAQWDGLPKLLRDLVGPVADDGISPGTRWDEAIFAQLILSPSFISTYVPTGALLLTILGYLAGLALLVWLWQKKRLPQRTLIMGLAAFVISAGLAGYLLFSRGGNIPDGVILSSTVLDRLADGYVEAQSNVAMFSTQIRQYNLQLRRGWIDMVPVSTPGRERPHGTVELQDGGGSSRYRLPLREWDYRLFRMRFIDRFPMRADFEAQPDSLLVKVDNQSGKDLVDCWLVTPGRRHALGDIPRGASWSKVFSLAPEPAPERSGAYRTETLDLRDISFNDKTRDILFHSSFFPRAGEAARWTTGTAVFFGWVREPESRVTVDDQAIGARDYTLFRAIVPLGGMEDE